MGAVQSVEGFEERQPGIAQAKEILCPCPLHAPVTVSISSSISSLMVHPEDAGIICFHHHEDVNNYFLKKSLIFFTTHLQTGRYPVIYIDILLIYKELLKYDAQILRSEHDGGEEGEGDEGGGLDEVKSKKS